MQPGCRVFVAMPDGWVFGTSFEIINQIVFFVQWCCCLSPCHHIFTCLVAKQRSHRIDW